MLAQQQAVIDELTSRVEEMSYQSKAYRREIAELHLAIEKMLKGNRREKFDDPKQLKLEFPDDPELQDALQEAQAEAAEIFETITYERRRRRENKKKGSERFPEHLRREYVDVEAPAEVSTCPDHGPRKEIPDIQKLVMAWWDRPGSGIGNGGTRRT